MNASLYIIVDVSGSMQEMGKINLQRNLCRYVNQLQSIDQTKYGALGFRFYQWASHISEIRPQNDGDIPVLSAKDSSNLCVLSDFFSQHLNGTGRSMVLILSDGYFSNSDIENFQKQLNTFIELIIRTVAVGTDANLLKLKKISTNNTVYLPEDIAPAIDSAIFDSDEPLTEPVSTAQILESALAETEELEEDWDA